MSTIGPYSGIYLPKGLDILSSEAPPSSLAPQSLPCIEEGDETQEEQSSVENQSHLKCCTIL